MAITLKAILRYLKHCVTFDIAKIQEFREKKVTLMNFYFVFFHVEYFKVSMKKRSNLRVHRFFMHNGFMIKCRFGELRREC